MFCRDHISRINYRLIALKSIMPRHVTSISINIIIVIIIIIIIIIIILAAL